MRVSGEGEFLGGVIEGFYGQPWSAAERQQLFEWMSQWKLNTYLYAPKDDLKHRAFWRTRYTAKELRLIRELVESCESRGLNFIYALSPGLDIDYNSEVDRTALLARFDSLLELGCKHFALLFDDIPDELRPEEQSRFGSFASAQCHVANYAFHHVRSIQRCSRFLFCPTAYCRRMADRNIGGAQYLQTVGRELDEGIDVFWTGPEIVSQEIPAGSITELQQILRRKPMIWDNLHANDYDMARFYCGPYSGRPIELKDRVSGILLNPNSEFELNFVPLRTLAMFLQCEGKWDARAAYLSALSEWLPSFESTSGCPSLESLIRLFDCFYLPHQMGVEAEALLANLDMILGSGTSSGEEHSRLFFARAAKLKEVCGRMSILDRRQLFYALSRRVWQLKEELDLLTGFIRHLRGSSEKAFRSDSHLPGSYRGGILARLQGTMHFSSKGVFTPAQPRIEEIKLQGEL